MRALVLLALMAWALAGASGPAWAQSGSSAGAGSSAAAKKKPAPKIRPLADNLKPFDTNGDGKLDAQEQKAMKAAQRAGTAPAAATPAEAAPMAPAAAAAPSLSPEQLAELSKQYDADGDGQLNDEERAAMQAAIASMAQSSQPTAPPAQPTNPTATNGGQPGNPNGPMRSFGRGGFGGGGFGGQDMTDAQREAMRAQWMMRRYDSNGDGQLDDAEKKAMETAQADMEKRRADDLKQYDTNGDGQLDDNERQVRNAAREQKRVELMAKYDKNRDGQLDDSEQASMKTDGVEMPRTRGRGGFGGFGGRGGPGGFQPPPELVQRFDVNKDGQLDDSERQTMRAEFEKMRSQGGGFAGFGGPSSRNSTPPAEVVKRFDTNGDGKLDEQETSAMRNNYRNSRSNSRPGGSTPGTNTKSSDAKSAGLKPATPTTTSPDSATPQSK
jgi:Ca2+-binding EF-hand superfamily protein